VDHGGGNWIPSEALDGLVEAGGYLMFHNAFGTPRLGPPQTGTALSQRRGEVATRVLRGVLRTAWRVLRRLKLVTGLVPRRLSSDPRDALFRRAIRLEKRMLAFAPDASARQSLAAELRGLFPRLPSNGATQEGPGAVEIDAAFDEFLTRAQGHVEAGRLWNAPIGEVARRMAAFKDLRLDALPDGVRLANRGRALVAGLTVRFPPGARVEVRPAGWREHQCERGGVLLSGDLPAGEALLLRSTDAARGAWVAASGRGGVERP
jgi:hypothetical protein